MNWLHFSARGITSTSREGNLSIHIHNPFFFVFRMLVGRQGTQVLFWEEGIFDEI